jgi:O-antigen ligase
MSSKVERVRPPGNLVEKVGEIAVTILDKSIFASLLAIIVLTAIPYGTVEPWWEAVFECGVFALLGLTILHCLLLGYWQIEGWSMILPLSFMALFIYLQTMPIWPANAGSYRPISIDIYQTRITLLKFLAFFFFFVMLLRSTSSRKRLLKLFFTVIGVGLASASFGILRQLTQHGTGFLLAYLLPGQGYAQFIYHNAFSCLGEMSLALVLALIVGGGVSRKRFMIYLAIGFLIWAAVVLSNSRGGIIGMLGQFVFLGLSWFLLRRGKKESQIFQRRQGLAHVTRLFITPLLVVALIVIGFLGALWMGGERLTKRFQEQEIGAVNKNTRLFLYRSTLRLIRDKPVAGVGFGCFWLAIPDYLEDAGKMTLFQAHNDYLDLIASGGLIAAVLASWFIFAIVKRARSALRSKDNLRRAVALGAGAGLVDMGLHSLVDFGLQITHIAVVFSAVIVLATVRMTTKRYSRVNSRPRADPA